MSVFTDPSTGPPWSVDDYDERAAQAVKRAKERIKEIFRENPAMLQLYKEAIAEMAEETTPEVGNHE